MILEESKRTSWADGGRADASDLKSDVRKGVRVRFPLRPPGHSRRERPLARRALSKKAGGPSGVKRAKALRPGRARGCPWHLYVVECADGSFYVGIAKDVERRVRVHNSGRGARYTSMRLPVRLLYSEVRADVGEALRREREIKRWSRPKKIERLGLSGPARLTSASSVEPSGPGRSPDDAARLGRAKRRRRCA